MKKLKVLVRSTFLSGSVVAMILTGSCSSTSAIHGAWKRDGSLYVASDARRADVLGGYSRLRLGMTEKEVREVLGAPDHIGVVTRGEGSLDAPVWRPVGRRYEYVIKDVGSPGNGKNEYISVFFGERGRLEETVVKGIPEIKPLAPVEPR